MILKNISVTSFRNLEQTDLSFGDGFNIFFGNNAQGKTNLLESIYLLGTMKSFRMARNSELIRWGIPYGILRGAVERDGVMREIALLIEKGGKKARIDRKSVVRISDFFGSLNVVVFSPDEMAMAKGQPENRRRYLDRAIFSGHQDRLRIHHDYYRILKNRNILLKTGETDDLHAWDVQFAQTGARLMSDRIAYLDEIAPLLRHYYLAIAGGSEEAGIRYLPHPAEGVYKIGRAHV